MPADVLSGSHHPRLLVRPEAAEPKQGPSVRDKHGTALSAELKLRSTPLQGELRVPQTPASCEQPGHLHW